MYKESIKIEIKHMNDIKIITFIKPLINVPNNKIDVIK